MDGFGVPDGLRVSCFGWREWIRRSVVYEGHHMAASIAMLSVKLCPFDPSGRHLGVCITEEVVLCMRYIHTQNSRHVHSGTSPSRQAQSVSQELLPGWGSPFFQRTQHSQTTSSRGVMGKLFALHEPGPWFLKTVSWGWERPLSG